MGVVGENEKRASSFEPRLIKSGICCEPGRPAAKSTHRAETSDPATSISDGFRRCVSVLDARLLDREWACLLGSVLVPVVVLEVPISLSGGHSSTLPIRIRERGSSPPHRSTYGVVEGYY